MIGPHIGILDIQDIRGKTMTQTIETAFHLSFPTHRDDYDLLARIEEMARLSLADLENTMD